ncbi:hypothetical protein KBD61_01400 [Patescibacteria group bacterium]|nr:hypothetical protein [Patescibacteria group bacterium]MBP9709664.1 hypothetical protein [Patescibacteria group bacterium]
MHEFTPRVSTHEAETPWQEAVSKLRSTESAEERQRILNTLFPLTHRKEMVNGASTDRKGRKVLYYRYIKWDKLFNLLERGKQMPMDYVKDPQAPLSAEDLYYLASFIKDYAIESLHKRELRGTKPSLEELLNIAFPHVSPEERARLIKPTYAIVLPFIRKYVDQKYIGRRHTGSMLQRFSPFLGMSVGGPISPLFDERDVYIEMVIPDRVIIPHSEGVQGEKEVFIEEIRREYISRVHASGQLYEEAISNPSSMIGTYYADHPDECRTPLEALDRWRWSEKTEDCLPAAVAAKIENT